MLLNDFIYLEFHRVCVVERAFAEKLCIRINKPESEFAMSIFTDLISLLS